MCYFSDIWNLFITDYAEAAKQYHSNRTGKRKSISFEINHQRKFSLFAFIDLLKILHCKTKISDKNIPGKIFLPETFNDPLSFLYTDAKKFVKSLTS